MSKTFDGIDTPFIRLQQETSPSKVSIFLGDNTTSGIYFMADGTVGITNLGIDALVFNSTGMNVNSNISSIGDFECRNLKMSVVGSNNFQEANYIGASYDSDNAKTVYFTYFDSPRLNGSFMPSASYNVFIAGPPSSGLATFSLYVNSGAVYMGGSLNLVGPLQFGSSSKISINCSPNNNLTYTLPDVGTNANFLLSSSTGGQILNAASFSGTTIKGGIVSFSTDTSSILNYGSSNTIHLNYFAAPTISSSAASLASNVYIAGPPSGATTSYSLLVNTGTSQFGGPALFRNAANSIGFINDSTTGISYNSAGSYSLVANGTTTATVNSSGLTIGSSRSLNFTGQLLMQLSGVSHFSLSASGLATIANGYPGAITSTVSVRGTVAGTGFSTTAVTLSLYYFPLGGKCYYTVIASGTSTLLKTGAAPSASNYLTITFSDFTSITSAFLTGVVGTYTSTSVSTTKNIALNGYTYGTGVSANSIIMVFPTNSTLVSGNLWTGTTQTLTAFFSGIIFADK